jgi:hypothetical protein
VIADGRQDSKRFRRVADCVSLQLLSLQFVAIIAIMADSSTLPPPTQIFCNAVMLRDNSTDTHWRSTSQQRVVGQAGSPQLTVTAFAFC